MTYSRFLVTVAITFGLMQSGFGQDTYGDTGKANSGNRDEPGIGLKVVSNVEVSEIGSRLLVAQGTDFSVATAFPSSKSGAKQKIEITKLSMGATGLAVERH